MLHALLTRFVHVGCLTVHYPDGRQAAYGDGSGPETVVRLHRGWVRRLAMDPQLRLGEAYMDGGLVIERGDVWTLLEIVGRNLEFRPRRDGLVIRALMAAQRRLQHLNSRAASRRNVAHHYDLSEDFYRRFLDEDMQYSCAYFSDPGMTLEEAQAAKRSHIAAKLRLEPGTSVLDVGCGWGGLGLDLAQRHGAQVTGVTLSGEQLAVAQMRIQLENMKSIFWRAINEARANPDKDEKMRLYAAHYSVMEGANDLARLAIRTCGGQSMLKHLPLERLYRDSRCGALMLPWTAELVQDRMGRETLYEAGERDA